MPQLKITDLDFDLIIKNGTIYDGSLSEPFKADIGINGEKIEFVGQINGQAAKTIDATGHIVTPGFIDVHTHCDSTFAGLERRLDQLDAFPGVKGNLNYIYQGVTTIVSGNCGGGFSDINHWFDILDKVRFGTNVYHLAPHGAIRGELFGDDQPEVLNTDQMAAMKRRVEEEMEKGAVGFSTGLEYAPGLLADIKELVELNKIVNKHQRIYTTHMRSESGIMDAEGITGFERAFNDTMEVARQAEVPVEISHLKIEGSHDISQADLVLDLIEKARSDGLRVTADQYPYNAGSSHLAIRLPDYLKSDSGIKDKYKVPEARDEIIKGIRQALSRHAPDKTQITMYREKRIFEGKTVAEIAEMEGKDVVEVYADMLCEKRAPMAVFFTQDMDIVRKLMPAEFVSTGSDGWTVPFGMTSPHPRTYGTFPGKIKRFVLEEKILSLEQAIHSMTGLPADTFKMAGRGKIKEGNFADITVIDLENLEDNSTYVDPHHYAKGMEYLIVNGILAIEHGKATDVESGKALRA